jgi:hypothetical protein
MSKAVDDLKAIAKDVEKKEYLSDIPRIQECVDIVRNIMVKSAIESVPPEREIYFYSMVATELLRSIYLSIPIENRSEFMQIINMECTGNE